MALLPDEERTARFMASMVEPPPVAALNVRPRLRLARLRLVPMRRDWPLNDQSAGWLAEDAPPSPPGAGCHDSVGAKGDDAPPDDALGVLVTITGRVHTGMCACNRSASRSTTSCASSATA